MYERMVAGLLALRDDAAEWCTERSALPRLPLLAYLAYAGIRHMANPLYRSWFAGITLVFHEMGHLVFAGCGRTLHILGGTIFQLLVPFLAAVYLLIRQRDYFGLGVGGAWLSFSLWDVAVYVSDANKENLPLVGFGANPEHDWSTLLTEWHVLNSCDTFAAGVRIIAFLVWAASMTLAGWLCSRMWKHRGAAV